MGLNVSPIEGESMGRILHWAFFTPGEKGWGMPALLLGEPGEAKCLGRGTLVLMYDGTVKPVEDIKNGDVVMGPDSQPRHVTGTVTGIDQLYRIVPVKGESWVCNEKHVLTLAVNYREQAGITDVPLNEYLHWHGALKWHSKLFQPGVVHFPTNQEPSVDPYFLGVWLGDGTKNLDNGVQVSKPDAEIKAACDDQARAYGLRVSMSVSSSGGCPTYRLVGERGQLNPLLEEMRRLMIDEIRVPQHYKTGSLHTRLNVLAGLLDTDGTVNHGGYAITQKSKPIADDIAFLARSLGLRVTYGTQVVDGQDYIRLNLSGDMTHLPLRIARKMPKPRLQKKNALRTGFSVEPIGEGEYFGFSLDEDGRFLLGDFTVTHNTSMVEQALADYGMPVQVMSPGEMGEAAFGVVPVPDGSGIRMRLKTPPPDFVDMFDDADCGGVFLDELTGANDAIGPAMLALLRERRLGGYYFGTNVRVLAAANPPEIAANGHDLSIPAANRIVHIPWGNVDPADAQRYALARLARTSPDCLFPEKDAEFIKQRMSLGTQRRLAEEARVAKAWSAHLTEAIGVIGAFKQRKTDWAHKRPKATDKEATGAWPSTRSWDLAQHAYAGAKLHGLNAEELVTVVAGCVGLPAASELFKFLEDWDLPDPKDLLTGRTSFKIAGERLDRAFTVMNSCIALISTEKEKPVQEKYAAAMWGMIEEGMSGGNSEIVASPAKELAKLELYSMKEAAKPLHALEKLARAVRK